MQHTAKYNKGINMNYVYESVELSKNHMQWPNLKCFKLKNIKTGEYELALYLNESDAIVAMNKKNNFVKG